MATYKKCDYIDIIKMELRTRGQRLTNLSKVSIPRLKELCIKYNIDIDAIYPSLLEQKKELALEKKQKKQKEEIEWKIREEEYQRSLEISKRKKLHYENLPQKIKDTCVKIVETKYQEIYEKELQEYADNYDKRVRSFNVIARSLGATQTFEEVENADGSFVIKGVHFDCSGICRKPTLTKASHLYDIYQEKEVRNYLRSIKAYHYRLNIETNRLELITNRYKPQKLKIIGKV